MKDQHSTGIRRGCGMLVALAVLTGCAQSGGGPAGQPLSSALTTPSTPAEGATSAPVPDSTVRSADVIPDGVYERIDPPADTPLTLKIQGARWTQFGFEGGAMVVGDLGTTSYDGEGHWVTQSESTGCPGCVGVLDWSVAGDVLTLRFVKTDPRSNGAGDREVYDGRWRKSQ